MENEGENYQSMADFKPSMDAACVKKAPYQFYLDRLRKLELDEAIRNSRLDKAQINELDSVKAGNDMGPITPEEIDEENARREDKIRDNFPAYFEQKTQDWITQAEAAARFTNISPEDGRYRGQVEKIAPYVNEAAYVRARVIVETLWLRFLMNEVLPQGTLNLKKEDLQEMMEFADNMPVEFTLRVGQIEAERKHDVIAVIEAMRERFSHILTPETEGFVHLGLTSEDVNDLSQKFMFINALNHVLYPEAIKLMETFQLVGARLDTLRDPKNHGSKTLVNGQFRDQSLGLRYKKYADAVSNSIAPVFVPDYLTTKFSGATGTHAAMGIIKKDDTTGREIGKKFCKTAGLDLHYLEASAQINPHDDFVLWALHARDLVAKIEKICDEIWDDSGTDYQDMHQEKSSIEGKRMLFIKPDKNQSGSSAMPQKVQVINVENARATAQLLQGTLTALIETLSQNKQQRELSDSRKIREVLGDVFPKLLHMLSSIRKDIVKLDPNPECAYKGEVELIKEPVKYPNQDKPHLEGFRKFLGKLSSSIGLLDELADDNANIPILGKTHNQPASPLTLGLVFATYAERLRAMKKSMWDYDASPSDMLKQVEETTQDEAKNYNKVVEKIAKNLKADLKQYRKRELIDYDEFSFKDGELKITDLIVIDPACATELENHYECLGEAIQTVLRRHQVPNAYDIVKKFTRGTQMNRAEYRGMVEDLLKDPVVAEKLPDDSC